MRDSPVETLAGTLVLSALGIIVVPRTSGARDGGVS